MLLAIVILGLGLTMFWIFRHALDRTTTRNILRLFGALALLGLLFVLAAMAVHLGRSNHY